MLRLIIISFPLLQQPAECHRSGDKEEICCNDHHDHRKEKENDRRHRIDHHDRQIIGGSQDDRAKDRQHPVGPGRFLAHLFTFQKFHRTEPEDRDEHPHHDQDKDPDKQPRRCKDRPCAYLKTESDIPAQDLHRRQFRKPGEKHAEPDAGDDRDEGRQDIFPGKDPHQVALAHAQDIVKSEFFLPPADQK